MGSVLDGLSEPTPRARFLWWWQHHPWMLALIDISLWVSAFALPGSWSIPFTVLAVMFGLAMTLSVRAHSKTSMCPGCSFDRLPDNPDAEVKRYHHRLRIFHVIVALIERALRLTKGDVPLARLLVTVVWLALWYGAVLLGMIQIAPHQSIPAGLIGVILLSAEFSAVGISHNRLGYWCPWCRDHGGGEDPVVEPDPDPADEHTPDLVST